MNKRAVLLAIMLVSCRTAKEARILDSPSDGGRHRAALATVTVDNMTTYRLTVAFRSAAPPVLEVIIGKVEPGVRSSLAPVPAGEPIVLIARQSDGSELVLAARSFPLDAEWTWQIPRNTTFVKPAAK